MDQEQARALGARVVSHSSWVRLRTGKQMRVGILTRSSGTPIAKSIVIRGEMKGVCYVYS
jgi:hypothetical protein